MSILYFRNSDGKFVPIHSVSGKSAYEIAVEKGVFEGTEEEFAKAQVIENKEIIDQITQENIDLWNAGGGGEVNLDGYATKDYVDDAIKDVDVTSQLQDYAKKSEIPTVTNDLTDALKGNYDTAYTHSQSTHAPTNAQKNSDITKAEIEAKLTGVIVTHTHPIDNDILQEINLEIEEKASKDELEIERARIDSFTRLAEGSTTGDAELIDGRIGADGVTYSSIGDAIRTQYSNLSNLLDVKYEAISNNCIDDSKYVGNNFDAIFGHGGGKTFKLDKRLTSNQIKGFIEFEDGTHPDIYAGFSWSLISSTGEASNLTLSVTGSLVASDDFDKYDEIYVECWTTYDQTIKTIFVGAYTDDYDSFKTKGKSKAIEDIEKKVNNITPEQCTFFDKVDNLLENVALSKGYAINPSYGLPDAVSGIARTSTDYIELRDGCESTYCNTNGYIYYYDENKAYLQSITPQGIETAAGIVALPQSDVKIKYIRYTFVTEDDIALASYWITDKGKPYENDKLYIPKDMIEDLNKAESWYKGKKICAYGDSVTEQNKWQPYVSSYFNCSFYNRGVGGTTVTQVNGSTNHMSGDMRIESIPTDSDVILVFAGHNDWSYASIPMGDLKTDSLNESTSFKSAFALMLKKIQTRCPNAKIMTVTPVGGRTEDALTNQDKQFYIRDLCMTDFANAVREVSSYYGIPCIDVNANSGINTLNHTTYIADLIHPNEEGGKLIANEIVNGMKKFEPIVFD